MPAVDVEAKGEQLRAVLAAETDVQVAWLFGSVATGRSRSWSDVDIALLLAAGAPRGLDRLVLLDRVAAAVARVLDLPERSVDVVALEEQGPVFQHTVLRTGRRLYERDPRLRCRFTAAVVRRYLDFKPTLDLFDRVKYRRGRR